MEVFKEFSFDAAHSLPNLPKGHKCRNMHGHTYLVTVYVSGAVEADAGWVCDFAKIKDAMQPLLDILDHKCLNDIPGLEQPTCENLAKWMWEPLHSKLPGLSRIMIRETTTSGVVYDGE